MKKINLYKNKSIQYIISISFTIIAVIGMITLGEILYIRFVRLNEEIISKNNKAIVNQVNLNLDSYLRNIMKISDGMYYNVIKKVDFSKDSIDNELNLLYETNKDFLVSITLFSKYGEIVAGYPFKELKESIEPRDNAWFINAVNKKENLHFSTPHVQNLFVDPSYRYRWVVSLSRAVELTYNGETSQGILLVDMNFSGIEQIFKNIDISKSGYVYLVDSKGEIIYHPRQQLIYSNLMNENNEEAVNYEDGTIVESFNDEERVVTTKTVGYTGWKIVAVTPMKDITENYSHMRIFLVLIIFFGVLNSCSQAPKLPTSTPCAFNSLAFAVIDSVIDGLIFPAFFDKFIAYSLQFIYANYYVLRHYQKIIDYSVSLFSFHTLSSIENVLCTIYQSHNIFISCFAISIH